LSLLESYGCERKNKIVVSLEMIKKSILLFIGIIIGLFLVETIFYIVPSLGQKYSLEKFVTHSVTFNDQINKYSRRYRPSNLLGFEKVPNSAPKINSHGLIGPEFNVEKKEGTIRILVLGDSLMEENYFIEYLRSWFAELDSKVTFEIINGGVGSYGAWHYSRYLKWKGMKFNPDIVLVSFCLNDFSSFNKTYYKAKNGIVEYTLPVDNIYVPVNYFLFRYSYMYRSSIIFLENLIYNWKGDWEERDVEFGITYMGEIKKICKKNKIPLLCFIWPYFTSTRNYKDWQRNQYKNMIKVLDHLNIKYVDLHNYFSDRLRKSLRESLTDYVHPVKKGHKIAAEAIFNHLIANREKYLEF